jgi:hypothetical protein
MRALSFTIFTITCILLPSCGAWASSCLTCHPRVEMAGHAASCMECHRGHEDNPDKVGAHEGMIANPSDFTNSSTACGRCHEGQTRQINGTLMATAAGIINQTRFLWGAQQDTLARYAVRDVDSLKVLPKWEESGSLADDLLRRRCLRCHLGSTGVLDSVHPDAPVMPPGVGCAACHILNEANGIAPDQQLLAPGSGVTSQNHRLTTAIPTSQCLRCHNGNRAGADYAGLFERDLSVSYNFEACDPDATPHLMKHSYHYLLPDIHHERGMHCIDCHPVEELMGDGKIHSHSQEQVGVRCADCHGVPGKPPKTRQVTSSDARALLAARVNGHYDLEPGRKVIETTGGHLLTNTSERDGVFLLTSKVDGKVHRIPVLGNEPSGAAPLNHRIPGHLDKMECTACHAAWTFQDLGLHLVRLDFPDYEPWGWLTRQEDPQAREVLEGNLLGPRERWAMPSSRDWLTGSSGTGVWLGGYSMRRWEGRILGVNSRGLVSAMRPQYQYWLSWVDSQGKTLINSRIPRTGDGRAALAWNPYAPHTIRPQTVDCWDCHGNPRVLGLGQTVIRAKDGQHVGLGRPQADGLGIDFDLDQVIDDRGQPLQTVLQDGALQGEVSGGEASRVGAGFLSAEQLEKMSARNPVYIKYLLEFFEGKEAYGDPAGFTGPKE